MKRLIDEGKKMTLTQAASYLGISERKMSQLVKDGVIKNVTVDPLDKRRRLVAVSHLDDLKRRSLDKN